ncbi:unnamed protein product [Mytilus coruscus]|uniref:Death domain-containing protein n=1 Tax=Mytilus coruscus TaxID=42192 RepID=A0A6J8DVA3_MYTCO|nr:unnamed protein product [Mytilus coruscus]
MDSNSEEEESSRSLYNFLQGREVDVNKLKGAEGIVKHWVHSILTYCVDDSDVMPMILFAATHSDHISEDMQKKMKKEFVKKVTEMFGTHEMKNHIVFYPVFFINGTDKNNQEIQNLKNKLVSIALNQPSWGQRRPMIWVPLELLITNMKKENIDFILKSHLAEANTMNGELSLFDKQLDDFLLTQHALGKIMYFNQPKLNNFIVIYPPALVNILRSFITDEMFWPEDETMRHILRKMTNTGRIKKCDLIKLWQQKQVHQQMACDEFKKFVIQVLVHLDVLVEPNRHSGENDADVDIFLVPCTIKNKMPMSFLDDKSFEYKTISLVYRLQKRTIPSPLAFKLIGGIWPIKEENKRPLLYHSLAVLYVDSKTEFRIIIEDTRVIVYLTHIPSKFTISPDIAASIQECLTFTLNDVLKFYLTSTGKSHKNIDVSNLVQIEVGEVCDRSPCVFSISKAKRTSSWICCSKNQHFTKYPLLWIFDKTQEECPPDCTEFPNVAPKEVPNDDVLINLPQKLGNCALRLGIEIGITINSIEQTKTDYLKMYDQTADILRKWKNSTEEKPIICKLLVVLERVHLGGFQFVKDTYLSK